MKNGNPSALPSALIDLAHPLDLDALIVGEQILNRLDGIGG